jgi:hypothetical protein
MVLTERLDEVTANGVMAPVPVMGPSVRRFSFFVTLSSRKSMFSSPISLR